MRDRFRIRTREGRDFVFDELSEFVRLVRNQELSWADLIYDALTGEWTPARAHPVYRLVAEGIVTEKTFSGVEPDAPVEDEESGEDLSLTLAPPPPAPSPEEEKRAFIAEMEAERAAERETPEALLDWTGSPGEAPVISVSDPAVPATEPARRTAPASPGGGAPPAPGRAGGGAPSAPGPSARRRSASPPPQPGGPSPSRRPQGGGGYRMWAAVGLFLLTAAVAAPVLLRHARTPPSEPSPRRTEVRRGVSDDERAVRARAHAELVRLARELEGELGVGAVPEVWLEGPYLAGASAYPEVRAGWERMLAWVRTIRTTEALRFRWAYLAALDDAGVTGPARTVRLIAAEESFAREAPARAAVYDRVEGLAVAALQLHDLLVELAGRIRYVPARSGRLSADPVIEAVGEGEAQRLLEAALDRVTDAMAADTGGPGSRERVLPWAREQMARALGYGS